MSKKAVLVRVVLEYTNPSRIDMLHLSNGVFTARNALITNNLTIGRLNEPPTYTSSDWLHNLHAFYELSVHEWSDKTHKTILEKNKRGY